MVNLKTLVIVVMMSGFCTSLLGQSNLSVGHQEIIFGGGENCRSLKETGETVLGYCPNDIPDKTEAIGMPQEVTMAAAIRLPAARMAGLAGGRITKIRVGMLTGLQGAYVWIRGSLDQRPFLTQRINAVTNGWNEVVLDYPYEINGDEIYVGYTGKQPADSLSVLAGGEDNENAMFLGINNQWNNYVDQHWGSLFIQAVAEMKSPDRDLSLDNLRMDKFLLHASEKISFSVDVANQGLQQVDGYVLGWSVDGKELASTEVEQPLASGEKKTCEGEVSLADYAGGVYNLQVYLKPSAGATDEVAKNDTVSGRFFVYEKSFPRKALLEHFTTLVCPNCPKGERVLSKALEGRDDVVSVAHHVGYYEDELTIPESRSYLNFGVVGAPEAMVDRTAVPGNGNKVPFTIGYSNVEEGANVVTQALDYCLAMPALASVSVTNEYNPDARILDVHVSGECDGIFGLVYPDARLSVMLTENNVITEMVQVNADSLFRHNHVLRAMLTDSLGTAIVWKDGRFEYDMQYVLDKSWIAGNMHVVAVLNKPFVPGVTNPTDAQVLNAAESVVVDPTSVEATAWQDAVGVRIEDGRVVSDIACDRIEVYTTSGVSVRNEALERGLYLVRIIAAGNVFQTKVLNR